MKLKVIAVSVMSVSLLMTGCATKQDTGTLIGGAVGGIGCAALMHNSPNMLRLGVSALCAGAGALVGAGIGKTLDDRDRAELALQTQSALNSSASGVTTWKSSTSTASAKLDVSKPYTKSESVDVKRNIEVQPVAKMFKLNKLYVAVKEANVRASPSTNGKKLGSLPATTEFTAIGQTGNWINVARQDVSVGYVSADLVESKSSFEKKLASKVAKQTPAAPEPVVATSTKVTPVESATEVHTKAVFVPALKLDEVTAANEPKLAQLVDQPVVAEKVEAEVTCKTVKSTVTDKNGKVEPSTSELCKKPAEDAWANA